MKISCDDNHRRFIRRIYRPDVGIKGRLLTLTFWIPDRNLSSDFWTKPLVLFASLTWTIIWDNIVGFNRRKIWLFTKNILWEIHAISREKNDYETIFSSDSSITIPNIGCKRENRKKKFILLFNK
ncbi:hypothetical protein RhiirB3_384818 [Rhizophagus irregularis]|nr:hypothetical protein RhiirB3_384818 [Rhizophagus irregularis]